MTSQYLDSARASPSFAAASRAGSLAPYLGDRFRRVTSCASFVLCGRRFALSVSLARRRAIAPTARPSGLAAAPSPAIADADPAAADIL